ncbi:MAG TPA: class I SAM-dependent methyltransferase [Bryobacteraceae bacterium]|jgi:SAM-dependent methyltransferase|nr:class I SAM-dependent methyltransferase [Bryobacteraceae bacterium]
MSGIGNKRVLLIGNGESEKELAFLKFRPAALVYSDLSSAAVKVLFERYDVSAYSGTLRGAAIDALALPCHDASVDFVYGFAMVHHLPDVALFLAEVYRVLAPGGQCVFFDDAYAPLWQGAKLTVLSPLMSYSHRTTGISPEDLRVTMSGGFRPDGTGKDHQEPGRRAVVRADRLLHLYLEPGCRKACSCESAAPLPGADAWPLHGSYRSPAVTASAGQLHTPGVGFPQALRALAT